MFSIYEENFLKKYIHKPTAIIAGIVVLLFIGFMFLPSSFDNEFTSTTIESSDGRLLGAKIAADGQWRFYGSDSIPENYKQCVIMFEDKRFYYHPGVDVLSIARAIQVNVKNRKIVEGGSTITMQTVRLMRKGKSRTFFEKIIESVLAVRLEVRYSKETILRMYAQHAPFGGNVVGIEAAAWRYFGRSADDLSWAEAATLAVLPNAPSLIHPGRNRERLLQKRNDLLTKLCAAGYFPHDDLLLAQAEPLPEQPLPLPSETPHLLERLAKTHEGQNVSTTIQYALQQRATEVVNRHAELQRGNNVNNMAAIIIENETGKVLAYVGNVTNLANLQQGDKVDVITAPRSTGSILKPFLYAAMLDEGTLLPNMLLPDVPTYINGFVPQNYNKDYDGAIEAHRALERSLNIPSVLLLQDYGVPRFQQLLQKMNFSTITKSPDHYGLSLILGGAEVSLWETANAYASMARTVNRFAERSGKYSKSDWQLPKIVNEKNNENSQKPLEETGILSAAACWQIFTSLAEVNRPEGEEEWKRFPSSRKVAWKTGTSFGNRDAWAVGTTPKYTVGVWVGNATGEGRPMLTGVNAAAPVLFELFNLLPATSWFEQPFDEMTKVAICRHSGHRATNYCTEIDSMWIANSGLDSPPCPYHILVHLDRTQSYRVTSDCEDPFQIVSTPWFVLPPAQEYFYKAKNHSYKQLPPTHPKCLESSQQNSMELLYPKNGFHIVLTKQMDGSIGRLILQAAHRRNNATIYWHLNDNYLGATQNRHQIAAVPDTGRHVVTLVDDEGISIKSYFKVDGK